MSKPNILFFMVDQMRGDVLRPGSPCITPNLDRLAKRGVRFDRAYTPNAVCSPARASLMTGLLPHNHGVLWVTHTTDEDQCNLRTEYDHWANHLQNAGYNTGHFGKWHVERSEELKQFGWNEQADMDLKTPRPKLKKSDIHLEYFHKNEGYNDVLLYRVCNTPLEQRGLGQFSTMGKEFIKKQTDEPWCCMISVLEPHDPYVCTKEYYDMYDADNMALSENMEDDLKNVPGLYRKCASRFDVMTKQQKREALACYYASITEIDTVLGQVLDEVEAKGQLDNTIVVFTSDHGDCMGSHRIFTKNIGAYEENYHIPLVMAGPGVDDSGIVSDARVGLHDIAPTLTEFSGEQWKNQPDSRSFKDVCANPKETQDWQWGFAEFEGGRYLHTQRVVWDGDWKLVHNGFDMDELYNLAEDPGELNNLINDEACRPKLEELCKLMWRVIKDTNDHSLYNSHYSSLQLAPIGPNCVN